MQRVIAAGIIILVTGAASIISAGRYSLTNDAESVGCGAWPWQNCPCGPDPLNLGRPPVYGQVFFYKFSDGSEAIVQRLICRDTEAVLWWRYDAFSCPRTGECEAMLFPATVPWFLPVIRQRVVHH